jgi:hypothetical protein
MKDYGTSGGFYFMSMIGAAVYFVQTSIGFWGGVLGILKAFVWPAFVVYHLMVYFKA